MKSSLWYFLMALYTGEFSEDIIYIYIVVCNNPQRKTRIQEQKKKGRLHWLHVISTCLTSKTPLQKPSGHNWNIQIWGNYPPSKVPTNQWDMQLISTSNIDIFPFQKARNCHTNLTRMQRLGLPRIPARHQALCAGRRHALKRPWRLCSALWVCARFAGIQDLCWLDDFFLGVGKLWGGFDWLVQRNFDGHNHGRRGRCLLVTWHWPCYDHTMTFGTWSEHVKAANARRIGRSLNPDFIKYMKGV